MFSVYCQDGLKCVSEDEKNVPQNHLIKPTPNHYSH